MSKSVWNLLKLSPVVLGAALVANATAETAVAQSNSEIFNQIETYNNIEELSGDEMSQLTSVSQLRDVSPSEWAYEALRSLVERYGCIVGYPNGTFRGNRALTRWEFAAGLNACLNVIERLIQENVAVLREDIEKLQRLMKEFEAELAALGARVDNLEGRVAFLEDHQFSTTTKLKGEVIFAAVGATGPDETLDRIPGRDVGDEFTFSDRVRLNFDTSFTGKDRLRTRLEAGNIVRLDSAFGVESSRLGFDLSNGNDVRLGDLYYRFPAGDRAKFWVGTNGLDINNIFDVNNPFLASSGTGALSRFGRRNPLVHRGPGGAGAGVAYEFSDAVVLSALYLADDAEDPSDGAGLFNGSFSTGLQLDVSATDNLDLYFTYIHSYQGKGDVNLSGSTGSRFRSGSFEGYEGFRGSRDPFNGAATTAERFGIGSSWRLSEAVNWTAWGGFATATAKSRDADGVNRDGDNADIWTWNTNFSFIDVGKEGAVLSIGGGQVPSALRVEGGLQDRTSGYLVEALYKYPVNKNIIVTPGVYAIFNPNNRNDEDADTVVVGVIRTTFKF